MPLLFYMRSGFNFSDTPRIDDASERTRALITDHLSDSTRALASFGLTPCSIRLQIKAYFMALKVAVTDRVEVIHAEDPTAVAPSTHSQFQSITLGVYRPDANGRLLPRLRLQEVRLPTIDIAAAPLGNAHARWGLVKLPWNHNRLHQITPILGNPVIFVPHHSGGFSGQRARQKGGSTLAENPHIYMHLDKEMETDHKTVSEPRPSIIFREYFVSSYLE